MAKPRQEPFFWILVCGFVLALFTARFLAGSDFPDAAYPRLVAIYLPVIVAMGGFFLSKKGRRLRHGSPLQDRVSLTLVIAYTLFPIVLLIVTNYGEVAAALTFYAVTAEPVIALVLGYYYYRATL